MYLIQSTGQQVSVRNKLANMKLNNFESSSDFFVEFKKDINDLKSAGVVVLETEKLSYLLGTLPESMSHFADIVDSLPEERRTCEFVKKKIIQKENTESEKQG